MIEDVRRILKHALQLGSEADSFRESTQLLGAIPELDSMAVVNVVTMIEEEFGVAVEDDELSADIFETLGSLTAFVDRKLREG